MREKKLACARSAGGEARVEPELVAEEREGDRWEQKLRVPEDLRCWPDHFPTELVVPGVFQVYWVIRLIERWTGGPAQLASIEGLKFKNVLCPGERFTLTLERADEGAALRFRLAKGSRAFSLGRFVLAGEDGSGR